MTQLHAAAPAPAAPAPAGARVTVASDLLGALELPASALFTFAAGLYGFEGARRFALVSAGRDGLWWLQSAEAPALVFLLADPFHFVADYAVDVPDGELAHLGSGAGAAGALAVLVIVTLPAAAGQGATANLQAPVLLHAAAGTGRQVVLPDARWSVQTPLALG